MSTALPAALAEAATPVRVLAFGDSLTAGWTSFSSGPTSPFAPSLQRTLASDHDLTADVKAFGQAGLSAAQALQPLELALCDRGAYDVCLVLLGANDVLTQGPPSRRTLDGLVDHLKLLHETCRGSGLKSVALGMLDHPALHAYEDGDAALARINDRIRQEVGADAFIDPLPLLSASQAAMWSADQVHLTGDGYAALGRALAAPLAAVIKTLKGCGPRASGVQVRP